MDTNDLEKLKRLASICDGMAEAEFTSCTMNGVEHTILNRVMNLMWSEYARTLRLAYQELSERPPYL